MLKIIVLGFTQALRSETGGRAFPQCVFDHWKKMGDNPLLPETKSGSIVVATRLRKGLKENVQDVSNYEDKL